jgi:uncharacterized protein
MNFRQPRAFHLMAKPRGAICNLDCQYCFFLSKERLYPHSDFRMSDALLDEYTRQYIESQDGPEISFTWQGGEPTLMGLDFYKQAVRLQERHKKPGVHITNAFQTNAVLLDDAWCQFFAEHGFLVGVSLDGPRPLHDVYRVDKGGQPTFDRVMRGIEALKKHHVEFNILCTVNAANENYPLDVYRFFRDEVGAQFIQLIPIVERNGNDVTKRSVSAEKYGAFLNAIFDEWVRRDVGRVYVQMFDVALAAWAGFSPGLCVFEATCGRGLAMEHNGDVYSCDHFVEPSHYLGNIVEGSLTDIAGSDRQRQFGLVKRDRLPEQCRACPVRFACHGGCPKDRFITTDDGEPGLNYLCAGYKAFFTHIDESMRFMANELVHERPPTNVMAYTVLKDLELKARFARAGRNDPCPCGSGLKYKRCCARPSTR